MKTFPGICIGNRDEVKELVVMFPETKHFLGDPFWRESAKDDHQENDQMPHHLIVSSLACQSKLSRKISVRAGLEACRVSKRKGGNTIPIAFTMMHTDPSSTNICRLKGYGPR